MPLFMENDARRWTRKPDMENERQSSDPESDSYFVEPPENTKESRDRALLDEVLRETVTGETEALLPEEFAALQDVARRLGDEAFAVEPIGTALVEALLKLRWNEFNLQDSAWQDVTQSIADVLFDHPEVEDRLRRLWLGLREHVR